ncbi:MAG: 30S ribosomal protein S6 [Planctomycetes bacterium]|nr:30S ribosomal protein S6 [Planctomycetota bacterium]
MAASVYECMFILDTAKMGEVSAAEKQLTSILEKNNCEVLVKRPWDERRFSYPINNQKKGLYYLTYFRTEGKNVAAVERDCALSEMILRMMVLRIDPKLVDTMLSLAREEHAVALHNITQEPGDEEEEERGFRKRRDS